MICITVFLMLYLNKYNLFHRSSVHIFQDIQNFPNQAPLIRFHERSCTCLHKSANISVVRPLQQLKKKTCKNQEPDILQEFAVLLYPHAKVEPLTA
jgi:hypothetical protein